MQERNKSQKENAIINPKTINVFSALSITLKRIHIQLIAEGYTIQDGRISKSERILEIERNTVSPSRNRKTKKHH